MTHQADSPDLTASAFPERFLLIGYSARMLAQAAARAGLRTLTVDLFADEDTRAYAEQWRTIPASSEGFDEDALLSAADELAPPDGHTGLIYGGGIDTRPGLLERLMRGRILFGNPPETLRMVKTAMVFFSLLDKLGIPYPETRFSPPESYENWLIKSGCREGGKGVGFCAKNSPMDADAYFQRQIGGAALSALFLADRKSARIIGFNTQWTSSHDACHPFLFGGAINRAELSDNQRAQIRRHATELTRTAGLIGLNSLDFIPDEGVCRVLEVNPRPSATMALYDADYPRGLLHEHMAACRGNLEIVWREKSSPNDPHPALSRRERVCPVTLLSGQAASAGEMLPGPVRAFRIVYAPHRVAMTGSIAWPAWCSDRPSAGTVIPAGEPLCSVQAEGSDREEVEALLKVRATELCARLGLPD